MLLVMLPMMNCLTLLICVTAAVEAGTYRGLQTSLEDIEQDYSPNDKISSYSPPSKAPSPTKFGFIPHRTASSYAATRPKFQYSQTNYQVKKAASKLPKYQPQPYTGQQQALEYAYVQPEAQQYSVQYQQPQQYEQYDNVQYVADNGLAQPEAKPSLAQPQYYYVQQYQSPSTAVEAVVDPKGIQYVSFVPNAIPVEQKYQQPSKKYQAAQEEALFKREPKSLLDSYVPSVVQLRYLKQQGKRHSRY